jgi:hypothetical protein
MLVEVFICLVFTLNKVVGDGQVVTEVVVVDEEQVSL